MGQGADIRYCTLPEKGWHFLLKHIPLSSGCWLGEFCSKWLPPNERDARMFLRSCSMVLLINNVMSFMFLLFGRVPPSQDDPILPEQEKKWPYLHCALIVWQTHAIFMHGYLHHTISTYQDVAELSYLLPKCFALFFGDVWYLIAVNGGFRELYDSFHRAVLVAHHLLGWIMLLAGLICILQKQYRDCLFVG